MGQSGSTSSLHHIVRIGNVKQLKRLLKYNPSMDINQELDQQTALYVAVKDGSRQIVDLLLEHGADPNVICTIHENWAFPWSVMHEACWHGMTGMLQKLIECGANVDLEGHQKMSPLHIAAWFGHKESMKLLLNEGGCNVNHMDRFKESAIVMPVCRGDRESVRLLLMSGCRLNSRSWANIKKIQCSYDDVFQDQEYTKHGPFSLFTLAIKYAWLDIAILLLQHGFSPNKYSVMDVLEDIRCNVGTIDEDGQRLVKCYLAAGYRFRSSDERELRYLSLEWNQETGQDHGHWSFDENHASDTPLLRAGVGPLETSAGVNTPAVKFVLDEPVSLRRQTPLIVFNPDPRVQNLSSSVSKEFIQWLCSQDGLKNPHTLIQLCRVAIRNQVRVCRSQASIVPAISQLLLPLVLRDYLMLSEFGDPATERPSCGSSFQKYLDTEKNLFAMPRRVRQQHVDVRVNFWNRSCCCWN